MPRTGLEEITPEMVSAAAEYFGIDEDAALQKMLHAQAGKMRGTPMPQGMTVRDQYLAPSIFDVASSTIERIRGGQDEQAALAKLQAGILRKKDINTQAMQADMAQRNPALEPFNGAMMSPDPSTMTSENTFATTPPWEEPSAPPSRGVRKRPAPPPGPLPWEENPAKQSPRSPFYGFRGVPPFPLVK
jgi:hypothetical protein